jgi:hypothetical protein
MTAVIGFLPVQTKDVDLQADVEAGSLAARGRP